MEIVCATDSKYIMPTGIMLTSLLENNMGETIHIHLLHDDTASPHLVSIQNIVAKYRQNINFYLVNNDTFSSFPIGLDYQLDHVGTSLATYYRLYLAEILPDTIDKIIYLDGDILVVDRLTQLWNTDMTGYALGGVPDSYNNMVEHYNRLRYPQSKGYFNAGVLLVNLRYWREHNATALFLDYVKHYPERLKCHDQDVLNFVFMDSKLNLPLKYNVLNEYWFDVRYNFVSWEYEEQLLEAQAHPAIVHFTCIPKPWYKNCFHPYKEIFEKYKSISPWRNMKERRWGTWKFWLEKTAIRLVVMIGLRGEDYIVENRYINLSNRV